MTQILVSSVPGYLQATTESEVPFPNVTLSAVYTLQHISLQKYFCQPCALPCTKSCCKALSQHAQRLCNYLEHSGICFPNNVSDTLVHLNGVPLRIPAIHWLWFSITVSKELRLVLLSKTKCSVPASYFMI